MSEEKHMSQVWVSWEIYRRLLAVRGAMHSADGKIRNMDEVIRRVYHGVKRESRLIKSNLKHPFFFYF